MRDHRDKNDQWQEISSEDRQENYRKQRRKENLT